MLVLAFRRRPVVIGQHDEGSAGADLLGMAREVDRLGRGIGARPGDDRHPALGHLDRQLDDALMLLVAHGRAFAGSMPAFFQNACIASRFICRLVVM